MDIQNLSKQELNDLDKQIRQRQKEIRNQELMERKEQVKAKIAKLREHKEVLLELIQHGRSSCNDDHVCNGYGSATYGARCSKCHLIQILNNEWGDGEFDVDIEVSITRVDDY